VCSGAVGNVSKCRDLEIELTALGSIQSSFRGLGEGGKSFHDELVAFALGEKPWAIFLVDG
jgi:hypothetical protein